MVRHTVSKILLLFSIFSFLFSSKAYAAQDFVVNYAIDYNVSEQGSTQVIQNISLVNQQTNLYAREYSILIDSTKVRNISASDSKGSIVPSVSVRDSKTEIRLTFNDQVVGQGNILHFLLKYQDDNIAKKNGSIWEINIPGIAEDENLGDYSVSLHVPNSFGPAAYIVPQPEQQYRWNKKSLLNGGVSAAFGSQQVFDLTLSYYIENTKSVPVITEIALPPTTAYQVVTINSLQPKPDMIVADADGNWLARYTLDAQSSKTVLATISTQLFLNPRSNMTEIAPDSSYLSATKYWQVNDSKITAIASTLKTPRDVYNYVVKTLSYDYTRIDETTTRKGALAALESPKNSICMEFTDLFIALSRAAGIPARQALGYGFTTNPKLRPLSLVSDVLHAWPEYYDSDRHVWVSVDPTWGNTTGGIDYFDKLDFNHIVFSFNGKQDDYPYPAGFYHKTGTTGKDVEVSFRSAPVLSQTPQLTVTFNFPKRVLAGVETSGNAVIYNQGNVAAEQTTISVESADFGFNKEVVSPIVPPYGQVSVPFSVHSQNFLINGPKVISASVNGNTQLYKVDVIPIYYYIVPIASLLFGAVMAFLMIFRSLLRKTHIWKP